MLEESPLVMEKQATFRSNEVACFSIYLFSKMMRIGNPLNLLYLPFTRDLLQSV